MAEIPAKLLGREFGAQALAEVQRLVLECPRHSRSEIARRFCQRLGWVSPGGQAAVMSARVALLRLQRQGWIQLPAARDRIANEHRLAEGGLELKAKPVQGSLDQMAPVVLQPVRGRCDQSRLWNELVAGHHYLGHCPLAGAQIRFLVWLGDQPVGAVGFGAAAWRLSARERFIGWSDAQRQARLHLVLNNARFVLVPWVRVNDLASHVLGLCARQLPEVFEARYGFAPVLLESFVDPGRFGGVCYRAANWWWVGHTRGRGKKGPHLGGASTGVGVKQLWVRPLVKDFRRRLRGGGLWP